MCVPMKEIAPPWAAGSTHRGNTCGEWETMTAKISAHLGECKGGIPPLPLLAPGPFREKGLAPPAQGRSREGNTAVKSVQYLLFPLCCPRRQGGRSGKEGECAIPEGKYGGVPRGEGTVEEGFGGGVFHLCPDSPAEGPGPILRVKA